MKFTESQLEQAIIELPGISEKLFIPDLNSFETRQPI